MKHALAVARQLAAAEEQTRMTVENNRLLHLLCKKLGIPTDLPESADPVEIPNDPPAKADESPSGKKK